MKTLFVFALFLTVLTTFGQTKITGKVIDETGEPLPGANIIEKGTKNGATTDFDGKFTLVSKSKSGVISISFVGYKNKVLRFSSAKKNIGTVQLEPSNTLEEIVIVGTGIIDLAEDRKTPIAVSTIKAADIQSKAGNFDLPELLKSTPSVQTLKGGGFGDGQMYLRGFDQTNTAFLFNGQPINGMEDGKMYWSNWQGVLDVTNAIQVQRGLGSSKLAISSVGGTVNIVTKTIDKKAGGFFQQMLANNNYTKTTAYYSTGIGEKGWSFSGLLGYWQGQGYVDYTAGQGQTYFFSVGYQPNKKHTFNFILTGAPQWHAAAGRGKIKDFLTNGVRYNSWNESGVQSPNLVQGVYPGGRNIYHKPVANLSWDWKINDKSSVSSVLYGSLGRGAFASEKITKGSGYARGSYNNHDWFGLVSNYENKLNDNLTFNVGADVRTYNGIHFRGVTEFVGGTTSLDKSSTFSSDYTITKTYGGISPWGMLFNPNTSHLQRLGYDYEEVITYYGAFSQLEYAKDQFSAFFQGAISNQDHQKTDYFNYATAQKSKQVSNIGYNVKGGISFEINEANKVFGNAGYYSRQPFHDDLFDNIRISNNLTKPAVENQKVTGFELGYQFKEEHISANLNVYHTTWANRTVPSNNGENQESPKYETYQSQGVKEVHKGIELEVMTHPFDNLKINGFVSLGDWEFSGNATERTFDANGIRKGASKAIAIDGFKVGGAAQTTAGLSATYTIVPKFSVDANWNWNKNLYSTGSLSKRSVKLPSYNLLDAGLSYKPKLKNGTVIKSLVFRINIDNILGEKYLESVRGNLAASTDAAQNYKGVNINNNGRFGYGRTWNVSLRFNF